MAIIQMPRWHWSIEQHQSVVYCRVFLQPELQRFLLYVGSSSQSLGSRERTRWGKYKQIRAGKAVCGELCLWWHKRQRNFHLPVPLVFMQVPQASCLRTMEQTFINLLTPELNAPWVRRLVKSKHSQRTRADPVLAVRRRVVSWRQFKRYRRRALQLKQVQPSVFRSPRVVTAIVYALQLILDLASGSLKSFPAQKFLRSNYVDADTLYHLYRVASHLGDPYYETLCRSKLTDVLRFRQLPVPRPCMTLSIPLLLPQRQFARMVRSALDQCLSISEDRLIPYHIPTTRIIPVSHPKIKDVLHSHMDVVQSWTADETAEQMGWTCPCATIVADHPEARLVDGHVCCLLSQLVVPSRGLERACGCQCKQRGFSLCRREHGLLFVRLSPHGREIMAFYACLRMTCGTSGNLLGWNIGTTLRINVKWTVSDVLRLQKCGSGLVWHVRDHEGSHSHVFCLIKYWRMLDNTYLTASIFRPLSMHAGCAFTQIEQAVPDEILKHFSFGFQFRRRGTSLPWSYILPKHKNE